MKILMVSSESNPLFKCGGLADVVYSLSKKFITYKLDKMKETNEKTSYTIDFYVVNTSDGWTVSSLSNSDIEKLHGIYDYES